MRRTKPPIVFFADGQEHNVFDEQGGYVRHFVERTNLNILINGLWTCFGGSLLQDSPYFEEGHYGENMLTRIRVNEKLDVSWKSETLSRYMKKRVLEQICGIRLTHEERADFRLLKGFYLYGYTSFGGVFDTLQVMWRHRGELEEAHPRWWRRLKPALENYVANTDESMATWLHARLYHK